MCRRILEVKELSVVFEEDMTGLTAGGNMSRYLVAKILRHSHKERESFEIIKYTWLPNIRLVATFRRPRPSPPHIFSTRKSDSLSRRIGLRIWSCL